MRPGGRRQLDGLQPAIAEYRSVRPSPSRQLASEAPIGILPQLAPNVLRDGRCPSRVSPEPGPRHFLFERPAATACLPFATGMRVSVSVPHGNGMHRPPAPRPPGHVARRRGPSLRGCIRKPNPQRPTAVGWPRQVVLATVPARAIPGLPVDKGDVREGKFGLASPGACIFGVSCCSWAPWWFQTYRGARPRGYG